MTLTILAPAKLNLALEVLGRRDDGFHEVRTVMQAVNLCDMLEAEPGSQLELQAPGDLGPVADNLVLQAGTLLREWSGTQRGARVRLDKRIPIAAGLGGGSSDAAATLRLLSRLWELPATLADLVPIAARLGSDVPFFLTAGTALAVGRGEIISPVAVSPTWECWYLIIVPAWCEPRKTPRVYRSLASGEFTDGARVEHLQHLLSRSEVLSPDDLFNGLEPAVQRLFPGLAHLQAWLRERTGASFTVSGAGPALFAPFQSIDAAEKAMQSLRHPELRVFIAERLSTPPVISSLPAHPASYEKPGAPTDGAPRHPTSGQGEAGLEHRA